MISLKIQLKKINIYLFEVENHTFGSFGCSFGCHIEISRLPGARHTRLPILRVTTVEGIQKKLESKRRNSPSDRCRHIRRT